MNHGQHASNSHHHVSIRGWLQLFRVPNLLTAPGDPLAGALLASAAAIDNAGGLTLVALAGTVFYAAGTAMNDVMDARVDASERPGRPIPSGRVPRAAAAVVALALFAAALSLAFAAGGAVFKAGLALSLAIFAYNTVLKRIPLIGPLAMGSCRALNLLLGAALYPDLLHGRTVLVGAIILLAYVAAVTQIARRETGDTSPAPSLLWLPAGVLAVGMLVFACVAPLPEPSSMPVLTAFIVLACARAFVSTVKPRRGRGFRRAGVATLPVVIGSLVSNILFIQAALVAGAGAGRDGLILAVVLLALWPVNRLLAARFYAS